MESLSLEILQRDVAMSNLLQVAIAVDEQPTLGACDNPGWGMPGPHGRLGNSGHRPGGSVFFFGMNVEECQIFQQPIICSNLNKTFWYQSKSASCLP